MSAVSTRRVDPDENGFEGNGIQRTAAVEIASTRAAQEIQATLVVAKRFPRDETGAYNKIMEACKRTSLAEQAIYSYPRGSETVEGPTIRLAETMARAWGNIEFGIVELEQRDGESSVMAFAWDLETNSKQTKVFTIRHERHTRTGVKNLTDPRDIYELTANQGARRLRACILGIIPGDITDAAVDACNKTMAGNTTEPLADRVRKMLAAFDAMGVNQPMIERRLQHKLDTMTETELVGMKKIYRSLKDGMATVESFFPTPGGSSPPSEKTTALNEKLKAEAAAKQDAATGEVTQELAKDAEIVAPSPKPIPPLDPAIAISPTRFKDLIEGEAAKVNMPEAVFQKWINGAINAAGGLGKMKKADCQRLWDEFWEMAG